MGSGNGCVQEAERKISFLVWSSSPLTLLTSSSVNRLNGSGDGDVTDQPIKILEKHLVVRPYSEIAHQI